MASLEATTLQGDSFYSAPMFPIYVYLLLPNDACWAATEAGCEWRGSLQNGDEITQTYHDDQICKTLASLSGSQDDFYA